MKKIFLRILMIMVLVCTLVACNDKKPTKNDNSTSGSNTTIVSTDVVEKKEEITVDSIVELFGEDYNAQEYTSEMISYLLPNLERNDIILNGGITEVVHLTAKNSSPELDNWTWAYVYEFTDEADAISFKENRRAFVEAIEENGACVRCGLIVVFGSAPIISSIAQ